MLLIPQTSIRCPLQDLNENSLAYNNNNNNNNLTKQTVLKTNTETKTPLHPIQHHQNTPQPPYQSLQIPLSKPEKRIQLTEEQIESLCVALWTEKRERMELENEEARERMEERGRPRWIGVGGGRGRGKKRKRERVGRRERRERLWSDREVSSDESEDEGGSKRDYI